MANNDKTVIKCENPEVIKSIVKKVGDKNEVILLSGRCETDFINEDFKECGITTTRGEQHGNMIKLSNNFPDEVITCAYSFELNNYSYKDIVEYKNGEGTQVDLIVKYFFSGLDAIPQEKQEYVIEKTSAFFKEIDMVFKNAEGDFEVDFCEDEVSLSFPLNENYKIMATKSETNHIVLEILFKVVTEFKWVKVNSVFDENDDNKAVPF